MKMSREEMHTETLAIKSMLSAALATVASDSVQDTVSIIEMAQERAKKLSLALDSVNCPDFGANDQTEESA